MKKIVLDYYSCYNLGDDLFVSAFASHFSQCDIRLLVNPKCIPLNLPSNVKIHSYSYPDMLLRKLIDMCDARGKTGMLRKLESLRANCIRRLKARCDAYVKIGGSIFMQHAPGCEEIDFSTAEKPDFTYRNSTGDTGNSFIIGANLGPAYSESYWADMEAEFQKYQHICLRDYASYCAMRHMPNVQYAPDVLFLTPKPPVEPKGRNILISVIDIGKHTQDSRIVDAYYGLLEQAISFFLHADVPVTLASFCQWQGDERAVQELLARFPEEPRVSACCYRGDPKPVLEALAGASYIIGSRFHSVILGMSFGKPVFPIIYNCKTQHYLSDLYFAGRYARLRDLPSTTLEDVLYNDQHQITVDCSQHHRYAVNQFRGLEDYLGIRSK